MPKVGDKHFAYTAAGKLAADKESKRTGNSVISAASSMSDARANRKVAKETRLRSPSRKRRIEKSSY